MFTKVFAFARIGWTFAGRVLEWWQDSTDEAGHEGSDISEEEFGKLGACLADSVLDVLGIKLGVITFVEGHLSQEKYEEFVKILENNLKTE